MGKVVHRIVDLREAERGSVISLYVGEREIQCIISFSIADGVKGQDLYGVI